MGINNGSRSDRLARNAPKKVRDAQPCHRCCPGPCRGGGRNAVAKRQKSHVEDAMINNGGLLDENDASIGEVEKLVRRERNGQIELIRGEEAWSAAA
jgi:hypothetical protein